LNRTGVAEGWKRKVPREVANLPEERAFNVQCSVARQVKRETPTAGKENGNGDMFRTT